MDYNAIIISAFVCITAISHAYVAYVTLQTKNIAQETREIAQKTEVNTNSLVAKLMVKTAQVADAKGFKRGNVARSHSKGH